MRSCLKTSKKKDVQRLDNLIAGIRKEIRDLEKECPDINTTGAIEEIKYKDGSTVLVMTIPADTAFELDKQKLRLGHYKVTIRPDYNG